MRKAAIELSAAPYDLQPIQTGSGEYAWRYSDYAVILNYFQKNSLIVLGGDVLTKDMKYSYDNWYYNPDPEKTMHENVRQSAAVAEAYLRGYQDRHGAEFYLIFVVRRRSL